MPGKGGGHAILYIILNMSNYTHHVQKNTTLLNMLAEKIVSSER